MSIRITGIEVERMAVHLVGEKLCSSIGVGAGTPKGQGVTSANHTSWIDKQDLSRGEIIFDKRGAAVVNPDRLMFPTSHRTIIGVEGVGRVRRIILNCSAWLEVLGDMTLLKPSAQDWQEYQTELAERIREKEASLSRMASQNSGDSKPD